MAVARRQLPLGVVEADPRSIRRGSTSDHGREGAGRLRKWVGLGLAVAAVAGGLAFAGWRIYLNPATDRAVELVPPNALLYGNLFLDPSTHQKQALRDLLAKFPSGGTPDAAKTALEGFLDDALSRYGVDFTHDVEPWLGREVGFALMPPVGATDDPDPILYVATRDADATMKLVGDVAATSGVVLTDATHRDVDYQVASDGSAVGIVRSFLVFAAGRDRFDEVVDASEGRSLADAEGYRNAVAPLPGDRVALLYLSLPVALRTLEATGEIPPDATRTVPALAGLRPVAAAAFLRPDAVVVEAAARTGGVDTPAGTGALDALPGSTWAAAGVPAVGHVLRELLATLSGGGMFGGVSVAALGVELAALTGLDLERDVLGWMGDAAVFAAGTERLEAGGLIQSNDARRSAGAVERLGKSLAARGVAAGTSVHDPTHVDVAFADASLPEIVELLARPSGVWLTVGPDAARDVDAGRLGRSATFRAAARALPGYSVVGFLDPSGAIAFGESQFRRRNGSLPAHYVDRVKPNLESVSYVVLGVRTLQGVTHVRLMIGVK